MSQQINLVLPALRPRFNWLALPVVAGAGLVAFLLVVALAVLAMIQTANLKEREASIKTQLQALQQQVQSLGGALAGRHADSTLEAMIAAARMGLEQRQEVLAVVAQGDIAQGNAYSGLLLGFSRQIVDGVWLTGFRFGEKDVEIHGRLLDPALLPAYINRLNNEAAFAGRRFAALDMKGVDPADEKRVEVPGAVKPKPSPRYTEFALHTDLAVGQEKTR